MCVCLRGYICIDLTIHLSVLSISKPALRSYLNTNSKPISVVSTVGGGPGNRLTFVYMGGFVTLDVTCDTPQRAIPYHQVLVNTDSNIPTGYTT